MIRWVEGSGDEVGSGESILLCILGQHYPH